MRHLVCAHRAGLDTRWQRVAELGPGDSLGVGLAALLTGARSYVALDLIPFAPSERNAAVLEELVELFVGRADVPDDDEFPELRPRLTERSFPREVLDDERMGRALAPQRVAALRRALAGDEAEPIEIRYRAPWTDAAVLEPGSVDLVLSQAVLEHVDDASAAYRAMARWLAPGGLASHLIDYTSHGLARPWNGHWAYGDALWRAIRGERSFSLNRLPHGEHLRLARAAGLELVGEERDREPTSLDAASLAPRFRGMSSDDLVTRSALVQLRPTSGVPAPS